MEFLEANNPEWCDMWEELASYEINHGDPICVSDSNCWEYMGSTRDHHHLRHIHHPATDKTEFVYIERRRQVVGWN